MTGKVNRLRRFFCGLFGHAEVTRYRRGSVQTVCYLCEAEIGTGWHTSELKAPRPFIEKPRSFKEWTEKYDNRRKRA